MSHLDIGIQYPYGKIPREAASAIAASMILRRWRLQSFALNVLVQDLPTMLAKTNLTRL